jgi:hypothetical protein
MVLPAVNTGIALAAAGAMRKPAPRVEQAQAA